MDIGVWRYLQNNNQGQAYTFLFVVWLQKDNMDKDYIIFQEDGLFGVKNSKEEIVIPPQYMEMQPFSCGLSLVRNHQYQYAYIDTLNRQIVTFGKYIWCDPQFTNNYTRVKLKDNLHWGIIDNMGKIAIYPNLDYIAPLESFKLFGNYDAIKFTGKYKGKRVGYIIDHLSKVNLPINFEFMSDFELEKTLPSEQSKMKRKNLIYTSDDNFNDSSWNDKEDWEDQRLDAFEGDESNYLNIE